MMEDRRTDAFTANKFRWLDQVLADRDLTPLAFKCAYVLAQFMNRATMDAWPGQDRLAAECGVTKTGVRNAIASLRERCHLSVAPGTGRNLTSRYVWLFKDVDRGHGEVVALFPAKVQRQLPLSRQKGATAETPLPNKGATKTTERCNETAHKGATPVATNPLRETLYKPLRGRAGAAGRKPKANRPTPWPSDFTIDDDMLAYAQGRGFTAERAKDMFAAFRAHAEANDRRCVKWRAAWTAMGSSRARAFRGGRRLATFASPAGIAVDF